MEENRKDLKDYLDLLKRRKVQILAPAGVLLLVGVLVTFWLPPVFRSEATILIEEQEVPPDLVRSTVTSYADQRIQTIKHQVMTRSNLWKIVDRYGLYAGLRRRQTTEQTLERFVDDIKVGVISAEVVDRRTGQPTHATIAFTLSYDGETPERAQKVASELTSLFLAENLKSRKRNAQETTTFLKQESENLSRRIEVLEKKISVFKQRAEGALPELTQLNMQLMTQADRGVMDADQQIRALEEKKIYLEGQLATLKPDTPMITTAGERILDREERLKALRVQYVSSASYLSPQHPDLIKMKREIDALEKKGNAGGGADELSKKLIDARARLALLLGHDGEEHPDVIRSRKLIASLEKELAQAGESASEQPAEESSKESPLSKPENPAYILMQYQLTSTVNDLETMKKTREEMNARTQKLSDRLEKTPLIEGEYLDLTRDRENSVQKYHEIRSKLMEAQVSEVLETQRKGERFSLIDPPALPERPSKPNRPALLILSLALAAGGGMGYGTVAENLDHSVRTARALETIIQTPPLAVIPYMSNTEDRKRVSRNKKVMIGGAIMIGACLLAAIHFFWFPLDVIWFVFLRKLETG